MSYAYYQFGNTSIPQNKLAHKVGSSALPSAIAVPGGIHSRYAENIRSHPAPQQVQIRFRLVADSPLTLQQKYDEWLGLKGAYNNLYRHQVSAFNPNLVPVVGYLNQRSHGRLINVQSDLPEWEQYIFRDVDLTFEMLDQQWVHVVQVVTGPSSISAASNSFTITNNGTGIVDNFTVRLDCNTSEITLVTCYVDDRGLDFRPLWVRE